jgi:hypothetical protein
MTETITILTHVSKNWMIMTVLKLVSKKHETRRDPGIVLALMVWIAKSI